MSDSKRNYDAGIWGGGSLDKEGLSKYGLNTSAAENRGENAVWGKNSSGEEVFLGDLDMSQAGNKDLIAAHAKQANPDEVNHDGDGSDLSSTGDMKGALLTLWNGGGAAAAEEDEKEFEPVGKSEDHQLAEDNYDKHFEDGNPWDTTSATDSYQSAFDRVTNAGKEMTAGDYLRQRADDKKGGVNRFTHYLTDHNTLAAHESHRASMNAIKKAKHVGLEPPTLTDPGELYGKYKSDIDSVFDRDKDDD